MDCRWSGSKRFLPAPFYTKTLVTPTAKPLCPAPSTIHLQSLGSHFETPVSHHVTPTLRPSFSRLNHYYSIVFCAQPLAFSSKLPGMGSPKFWEVVGPAVVVQNFLSLLMEHFAVNKGRSRLFILGIDIRYVFPSLIAIAFQLILLLASGSTRLSTLRRAPMPHETKMQPSRFSSTNLSTSSASRWCRCLCLMVLVVPASNGVRLQRRRLISWRPGCKIS